MTAIEKDRKELVQQFAAQMYTRQHDEELFLKVFQAYVDTRQVIQFHKDLFDRLNEQSENQQHSNSSNLITFDLSPNDAALYAHEISSLAVTQKLQLWQLYLEQSLDSNHCALELFCVLLLHFNCTPHDIPSLNLEEFQTCIQTTKAKFGSLDFEVENSSNRFVKLLKLCHCFGQILLVFHLFSDRLDSNVADRFDQKLSSDPFNISLLHDYRDANFWSSYLSKLTNDFLIQNESSKRFSNELTRQVCRLIIQHLLFLEGVSFHHRLSIFDLEKYKRKAINQVLKICEQKPKLLFDLNIGQVSSLLNLKEMKRLIGICFCRYEQVGDIKFVRLLGKSVFKNSELFCAAMIHFVTDVLSDASIAIDPNCGTSEILKNLSQHQSKWMEFIKTKPKNSNSMWDHFSIAASRLDTLKPKVIFDEEHLSKLLQMLIHSLSLDSLPPGLQCQLLITLSSVYFSHEFESDRLKFLSLVSLHLIFKTLLCLWFFDFYRPFRFLKKLFVILAGLSGHQHLISSLVSQIMSKAFFRDLVSEELEDFTSFISKIERTVEPDDDLVINLCNIVRIHILINAHYFGNRRSRKLRQDELFCNSIKKELDRLVKKTVDQLQSKQIDFAIFVQSVTLMLKFQFNSLRMKFSIQNDDDRTQKLIHSAFQICIRQLRTSLKQNLDDYEMDTYNEFITFLFKNIQTICKLKSESYLDLVWNAFFAIDTCLDESLLNGHEEDDQKEDVCIKNNQSIKRKSANHHSESGIKKVKKSESFTCIQIKFNFAQRVFGSLLVNCDEQSYGQALKLITQKLNQFQLNLESDLSVHKLVNLQQLLMLIKCFFTNLVTLGKDSTKLKTFKEIFFEQWASKLILIVQSSLFLRKQLDQLDDVLEYELEEHLETCSTSTFIKKEDTLISSIDLNNIWNQEANVQQTDFETSLERCRNRLDVLIQIQVATVNISRLAIECFTSTKSHLSAQQVNFLLHFSILLHSGEMIGRHRHFVQLFDQCCDTLKAFLLSYRISAESALSVYNSLLQDLLEQLCRASFQGVYSLQSFAIQKRLESCALRYQRLLSVLSTYGALIEPQVLNLLAIFISQLQIEPVHMNVRKHLLIGFYKLLATIPQGKDRFDKMYSQMNPEGRAMFKDIYDNFEKFYKYRGYV